MEQEKFDFLVANQKIWKEQYEKNKKEEYADKLSRFALYRKTYPDRVKESYNRCRGK